MNKTPGTENTNDGTNSTRQTYSITAIGEVLWDVFPSGARFGGAPANFACTSASLAGKLARVAMVSAVGNDELGAGAISCLQDQNVNTDAVAKVPRPTGQVFIELSEDGSASYSFAEQTAWDNVTWSEQLAQMAATADVVCFGTLGQRNEVSRQTIHRFVQATPQDCLRVCDVNLRPPFYTEQTIRESVELANVLKLNEDELLILADLFGLSGDENKLLLELAAQCELDVVALTKGPQGAAICRDGKVQSCDGIQTDVVDTVGAGDAFTATTVLGLLEARPTADILRHACRVAAFVCSQSGATPNIPSDLRTMA